jgi:hypothetical protein
LNCRFSDLTIVCRDKVFPAHRVVVCPQSDYFARACEGEFKVQCFVHPAPRSAIRLLAFEEALTVFGTPRLTLCRNHPAESRLATLTQS